ncbi:hypothetical protein KHC28_15225 [Ancylobacter sonchi]|uniref:hypothetical protein n=1 Tax=Ancylobacter sonchi TaxID=1937790 RepID=UPI001BD4BCE3|nr:hypothetical protein [Ancylobacter sonchi]MBS7535005.1 hypothetical protein [Ancylobacter sonchi]
MSDLSPQTPDRSRLPTALNKPRLRRQEATIYLETVHGILVRPATLAKWAVTGGGPAFQHAGRFPLYPVDELDQWAAAQLSPLRTSTSHEGKIDA